jgi:hypothetical protein
VAGRKEADKGGATMSKSRKRLGSNPLDRHKQDERIHRQAQGANILKAEARARKKADEDTDAIIRRLQEVGHETSAPRNPDLYEEHKRNAELALQVHDLTLTTKRVSIAVDQDGNGGAFLMHTKPKSPGLVRQFVASVGRLLGRPVDTNHADAVRTRR